MRFAHTLTTTAPAEAIWQVWADVPAWPAWDTALESASLSGPFALGAQGRLKAKGSPASPFVISQVDPGRSYSFTTGMPLAQLEVRRTLAADGGATSFTHEVTFRGPLGWLWGRVLGPGFRAQLPGAMERIRQIAERSAVAVAG
jgi:Polyketide cyclase / dehydrase and lipid transport